MESLGGSQAGIQREWKAETQLESPGEDSKTKGETLVGNQAGSQEETQVWI